MERFRIAPGPHRSLADLSDGVAQEARRPARADDGAVRGRAGKREGPRSFRGQQQRRLHLGHRGKLQPPAVVRHGLPPQKPLHHVDPFTESVETGRPLADELHRAVAEPEAELDPAPGEDGQGREAVGHHRGVAGLRIGHRHTHHGAGRGHDAIRQGNIGLGAPR